MRVWNDPHTEQRRLGFHTARMLVTAGQNIDRLRGEPAFAHLCAADPVERHIAREIYRTLRAGLKELALTT